MVSGIIKRARVCAALFLLCTLISWHSPEGSDALAQQAGRFYRETGKTLAPEFLDFYDRNGGILQFGYPVSEARFEEFDEGKGYLVQWTERQRLEHHTGSAECGVRSAECVLLGLLGRELTDGREGPSFDADDGTRYSLLATSRRPATHSLSRS